MQASFLVSVFNIVMLNTLKSSQGQEKATPEIMAKVTKLLYSDYELLSARSPEDLTVRKHFMLKINYIPTGQFMIPTSKFPLSLFSFLLVGAASYLVFSPF